MRCSHSVALVWQWVLHPGKWRLCGGSTKDQAWPLPNNHRT